MSIVELLRQAAELEPERFRAEGDDIFPSLPFAVRTNQWGWKQVQAWGLDDISWDGYALVQVAVQEAIENRQGYWGIQAPYDWQGRLYTAAVNISEGQTRSTADSPAEAILGAYVLALRAAKETD